MLPFIPGGKPSLRHPRQWAIRDEAQYATDIPDRWRRIRQAGFNGTWEGHFLKDKDGPAAYAFGGNTRNAFYFVSLPEQKDGPNDLEQRYVFKAQATDASGPAKAFFMGSLHGMIDRVDETQQAEARMHGHFNRVADDQENVAPYARERASQLAATSGQAAQDMGKLLDNLRFADFVTSL